VIEFFVDRLKQFCQGDIQKAMPDPSVEREMRELCARLDAMETKQR
jgi:hypothetical protein